jgi:hypothetical protein
MVDNEWVLLDRAPSKQDKGGFLVRSMSEKYKLGEIKFVPLSDSGQIAPE